jgi:hypothetical protein
MLSLPPPLQISPHFLLHTKPLMRLGQHLPAFMLENPEHERCSSRKI